MIATDRRLVLAARRERLVRLAAQQRLQLGVAAAPLAEAWRWVDRGIIAWALFRRHRWLIAVPVALAVWWRPRALVRGVAALPRVWRLGSAWLQRP